MRLILALALLVSLPAFAEVTGPARVIDGDTIAIGKERIRLFGIDAPEIKQTCQTRKGKEQKCGEISKQALARLLKNHEVVCKGDERDQYKLLLAVCYIGWLNVNEQMVLDGWALAYRRFSKDYVRAEGYAKARREGMWRGNFVEPWEWRRNHR